MGGISGRKVVERHRADPPQNPSRHPTDDAVTTLARHGALTTRREMREKDVGGVPGGMLRVGRAAGEVFTNGD
jgi:hypothetical protein